MKQRQLQMWFFCLFVLCLVEGAPYKDAHQQGSISHVAENIKRKLIAKATVIDEQVDAHTGN